MIDRAKSSEATMSAWTNTCSTFSAIADTGPTSVTGIKGKEHKLKRLLGKYEGGYASDLKAQRAAILRAARRRRRKFLPEPMPGLKVDS